VQKSIKYFFFEMRHYAIIVVVGMDYFGIKLIHLLEIRLTWD